jgi:hypothetical protein
MTFRSVIFPLVLISGVLGTWYGLDVPEVGMPPNQIGSKEQHPTIPHFLATTEEILQTSERLACLERLMALKHRLKERTALDFIKGHLGLEKAIEALRDIDAACATHPANVSILVPGAKHDRKYYGRQLLARITDLGRLDDPSCAALLSRVQEELDRVLKTGRTWQTN